MSSEQKPTRVFISTPCYGGLCLEKYMISIIKLQLEFIRENIQMILDTTENESLVHRARNVAIGRFMQNSDCDFFLFIDADVDFDPKSVVRLVRSGHGVSVAIYPKKVIMWEQAKKALEDGDERDLSMLSSSLVFNVGATTRSVENGFVEVLDGPTGFMLISRGSLEKMHEHYKDDLYCINDHQNKDIDNYCAIFDCMIDPTNKRYLSEDYAFCRRWQQIGGKIYADVYTTLGHVGNLPFSGCLEERLKV